ncbi:Putative TM nitroreductase [Ruminococcaceae bacterium YRB3002]|nr:Putative TM nitroreductase [Ruminococcaceae bacterium YRB3002]
MALRHTVRKFRDEALSEDEEKLLKDKMSELNERYGLSMKFVANDPSGVNAFARMFMSSGAKHYFILSGDGEDFEERLGYAGAELTLFAQTKGLNTWWIGGTYNTKWVRSLAPDVSTVGIIVVGHGVNDGVPHKSKTADQVSSYKGEAPAWFVSGVEAALLAPTALNRQKFTVTGEGNKVSLVYAKGPMCGIDQGIVKYHFELGAGKENFEWAE